MFPLPGPYRRLFFHPPSKEMTGRQQYSKRTCMRGFFPPEYAGFPRCSRSLSHSMAGSLGDCLARLTRIQQLPRGTQVKPTVEPVLPSSRPPAREVWGLEPPDPPLEVRELLALRHPLSDLPA